MFKWHRSAGLFRSHLIKDPLNPYSPPSTSLEEKHQSPAKNFSLNASKIEDIPVDFPTVSRNSLPFPGLTLKEIKGSILTAKITVPGEGKITTNPLKMCSPSLRRWSLNSSKDV